MCGWAQPRNSGLHQAAALARVALQKAEAALVAEPAKKWREYWIGRGSDIQAKMLLCAEQAEAVGCPAAALLLTREKEISFLSLFHSPPPFALLLAVVIFAFPTTPLSIPSIPAPFPSPFPSFSFSSLSLFYPLTSSFLLGLDVRQDNLGQTMTQGGKSVKAEAAKSLSEETVFI